MITSFRVQSSGEVVFGCSKDVCKSILVGFLFCNSRFEYIEYTFFLLGKDSAEIALQGVFWFLKIVKWRWTADLDLVGLLLLKQTKILKNLQASVLTDHRQIINLLNNMFGNSWIFSKYQQKVFWWNCLKRNACIGTKWITLALKDQFLIDPNSFLQRYCWRQTFKKCLLHLWLMLNAVHS